MPTVATGLQVKTFATGLLHPRVVYSLPNGVLAVESNGAKAPIYRPKDFIEDKVKGLGGSGVADQRGVLIDSSYPVDAHVS